MVYRALSTVLVRRAGLRAGATALGIGVQTAAKALKIGISGYERMKTSTMAIARRGHKPATGRMDV